MFRCPSELYKIIFFLMTICLFIQPVWAIETTNSGVSQPATNTNMTTNSIPTPSKAQTTPPSPTSILDDFTKKTGCKPTPYKSCNIKIDSAEEWFSYLNYCSALIGWKISYQHSTTLSLVIIGGKENCEVVAIDTHFPERPASARCILSKNQVNSMFAAFKETNTMHSYVNSGKKVTPEILKNAAPLVKCLKPLERIDKKIEIIPGAYNNQ